MSLIASFALYDLDQSLGSPPVEELPLRLSSGTSGNATLDCYVQIPETIRMYSWNVSSTIFTHLGPLGHIDPTPWLHERTQRIAPWHWWLGEVDLERLEQARGGQGMSLTITGHGIGVRANDPTRLLSLRGGAYLVISADTWRELIQHQYSPATWLKLPLTSSHWPQWPNTIHQLRAALRALEQGESREAIAKCFEVFDEMQADPHLEKTWKGLFDIDAQKEEGVSKLLAGFCGYINKAARHPSRKERDDQGKLARAEVDHYEAELSVAMALLIIAYIERLPRQPQLPQPS